jgi:hypothetical protein
MKKSTLLLSAVVASAGALGVVEAQASGVEAGGTIVGLFSDPILQGFVTNDPVLGSSTYFNNTSTAFQEIANSTNPALTGSGYQQDGSVLLWGNNSGESGLIFFGAAVTDTPSQPFTFGSIIYYNGTSALNSLIFGATLSLYETFDGVNLLPLGSEQVIITTTSNITGTLAGDADYVNICGNGSNICNKSIESYEESEGGTGVNVLLTGQIVGDPQMIYDNVVLAPDGQQPGAGPWGNVGSQAAAGIIPEPSTWAMMLMGFTGLGFLGYRQAAKARAARA